MPSVAFERTHEFNKTNEYTDPTVSVKVSTVELINECNLDSPLKEPLSPTKSPYVSPPSFGGRTIEQMKNPLQFLSKRRPSLRNLEENDAKLKVVGQIFFEELKKMVFDPRAVDPTLVTTFDSFPYFLSPDVKNSLIHSLYIPFQHPSFAPSLSDLESVGRKILLAGPPGLSLLSLSHPL